jgi:pyruvate formate lyase activating enzyme
MAGAGVAACPLAFASRAHAASSKALSNREAMHYEKIGGNRVICHVCPNECLVKNGERGACGVRANHDGTYRTLVYGRPCAVHVDPIEKKPLFHFMPGTRAYSLATAGCNVECLFCQNWQISQALPEDVFSEDMPPGQVVENVRRADCSTIAFTYSEPTVFFEYVLDTARAAREAGLHAVTISNGFIQADPLKELCEVLSAYKVDLKAFREEFYRDIVRGELKPVLDTIVLLREQGMHTELVTLLIPGLNDSDEEIRDLSRWVVAEVGPDVPLHFSRFQPMYKMKNRPRTPAATVIRARDIAVAEGVHYAYVGNLPGHEYESTFCHSCGRMIIERMGYYVAAVRVKDGKCAYCDATIPGVWAPDGGPPAARQDADE